MGDLRSTLEIAAMGLTALALTGAMVGFGVRVIRQAAAAGRMDRRSVWRLATMRVLVAALGISGASVVAEGSFLALTRFVDPSRMPFLVAGRVTTISAFLSIPLLMFVAASFGLMLLVQPAEVTRAARSFHSLKRLRGRARIAWLTLRRWPPCAASRSLVRRLDVRLW